jgi:hypothetical protein
MIENPIFIVGTERSGSNLLRMMIHQMGNISTPHPPHLLRDLSPFVAGYGDLTKERQLQKLVHHAARLVNWHFAPWPFKVREKDIWNELTTPSLYGVYAAIYELYRQREANARWCCKSTFMIHHVKEILQEHKSPQFIHLVRDPRDVALSAKKSIFSHYHPYFVAQLWNKEQSLAMKWQQTLSSQQWHTLRYEDLLRNPEQESKKLCAFLGTEYGPHVLQYFKSPTAEKLAGMSQSWENVAQPLLKNNSGKFQTGLLEREIATIDRICAKPMEFFGYATEPLESPQWSALEIKTMAVAERILRLKAEGEALFTDRNFWRRHRKRIYLAGLKVKALSHLL